MRKPAVPSQAARCHRCHGALVAERDGRVACITCGREARAGQDIDVRLAVDEGELGRRDRARYPRAGIPWSHDERVFLRRQKDRLTAREIGAVLGRSERSVHHFLSRKGLRKLRGKDAKRDNLAKRALAYAGDQKHWSEAEELLLQRHAGRRPVRWIAKRLRRSPHSVRVHASRMGLQTRRAEGECSPAEAAERLGIPGRTLRRWLAEGRVPAERSGRYWRVDLLEAARVLGIEVK